MAALFVYFDQIILAYNFSTIVGSCYNDMLRHLTAESLPVTLEMLWALDGISCGPVFWHIVVHI